MVLAFLSAGFLSLPPVPASKMGPSGADSQVGGSMYVLGPCGSLQWTLLWGWEFLLLPPLPPRGFQSVVWGFSSLSCSPGVAQSVSHPLHSSQFICAWMWDHRVRQPPFHLESSLPSCISLPLLPVRMNVSSLTPWLLDFHTVQFSVSSGCFLFLNCCCPSFYSARRHSVSTYASIVARSPGTLFNQIDFLGMDCF